VMKMEKDKRRKMEEAKWAIEEWSREIGEW
jgi:hypothetical protein